MITIFLVMKNNLKIPGTNKKSFLRLVREFEYSPEFVEFKEQKNGKSYKIKTENIKYLGTRGFKKIDIIDNTPGNPFNKFHEELEKEHIDSDLKKKEKV